MTTTFQRRLSVSDPHGCVSCHSTTKRHKSAGLCITCYNRLYIAKSRAAKKAANLSQPKPL